MSLQPGQRICERLKHGCGVRRQVHHRQLGARRVERGSFGDSLRRVTGEPHLRGEKDLDRVPTEICAVLVQDLPDSDELGGSAAVKAPVLSETRCGSQRAFLAAPADADRRERPLGRLRIASRIGKLVIRHAEGGCLPGRQQRGQDQAGLLETVAAMAGRAQLNAVSGGLLLVPASPDAQPADRRR